MPVPSLVWLSQFRYWLSLSPELELDFPYQLRCHAQHGEMARAFSLNEPLLHYRCYWFWSFVPEARRQLVEAAVQVGW